MRPSELAETVDKPVALAWIDAAQGALLERADDAVTLAALAVNFRIHARSWLARAPFVALVAATYGEARRVLEESRATFRDVSDEEACALFRLADPARLPPAYAVFADGVYFTSRFVPHDPASGRGFGPMCRAAMVLHESVHVVDRLSGAPAIHVSEWDEPRFSAQTALESIHNPSSYASFAAQIAEGALAWPREARWGAGRPAD